MLVLRGARLPHAQDGHHVDEFDVAAGPDLHLLDDVVPQPRGDPAAARVRARIAETIAPRARATRRGATTGPYAAAVTRSLSSFGR